MSPVMTHRTRFRFALIISIIGVAFCFPWAVLLWDFALPSLQFERSLRFYPDAREISRTFTFLDTNTGFAVRYYWVKETQNKVKEYFETFTEPFVENETVFYLDQESPKHDDQQRRSCYYQKFTCVEIRVIEIQDETVILPDIISERGYGAYNPPALLATPINSGTLIIYSFYTDEW